jgi:hypothetical protein
MQYSEHDIDQREHDQQIAVGEVVQQAAAPGAERRSQPAADRDCAKDGADAFAAEDLDGGGGDQGAARTAACSGVTGAPWPIKMGTIASLWRL